MIIFGTIGLAVLTAIFLLIFFKKYVVWWELLLLIGVPTLLSFGEKALVDSVSAQFTEYWGDEVAYVVEEEPWNEWVSRTCTETYACGTDSKGNTTYCTRTYDCSYQDDIGPKWYAITKLGTHINITESKYEKLKKQFGNKKTKTKTRHNYATRDRCVSSNGTKFQGKSVGKVSYVWQTNWNKSYDTQEPVVTKHSYENRIKASDYTVFNYIEVSKEKADSLKLYDYPIFDRDYFTYPSMLGWNNKKVQKEWKKINGALGYDKQVRIWVLIHHTTDDEIGILQENYWVGGNKNELVINIGVDKENNIVWNHIFTWSTSQGMVSNIEHYINGKKLNEKDMLDIANFTKKEVNKNWERLEFTQFDYLTVEPPLWAVILAYVFTLLVCIGLSVFIVRNDINNDDF